MKLIFRKENEYEIYEISIENKVVIYGKPLYENLGKVLIIPSPLVPGNFYILYLIQLVKNGVDTYLLLSNQTCNENEYKKIIDKCLRNIQPNLVIVHNLSIRLNYGNTISICTKDKDEYLELNNYVLNSIDVKYCFQNLNLENCDYVFDKFFKLETLLKVVEIVIELLKSIKHGGCN